MTESELVEHIMGLLRGRNLSFNTCVFVAMIQFQNHWPKNKRHEFRDFFKLVTDQLALEALESFEERSKVELARHEYSESLKVKSI